MDDRWIEVDFNQSEKTGKNRLIRISNNASRRFSMNCDDSR